MQKQQLHPIAIICDSGLHYARQVALGAADVFRSQPDAPPVFMLRPGSLAHRGWQDRVPRWSGALGFLAEQDVDISADRWPLVVCKSSLAGEFPRVIPDHLAVGRLAGEHLLSMGHRRVGFVNYPNVRFWDERLAGLRQAMESAGGTVTTIQWSGDATEDLSRQLAQVSAAFAPTDTDAVRLLQVVGELQIQVPEDLAVIGADDDTFLCEMADVPLSSVDLAPYRIGQAAAHRLWRALCGEPLEPTTQQVPPRGVVSRRSTDTLAYEDPQVHAAMAFIQEHGCEDITVESIMAELPISRRTLEVRFKQDVGRTLLQEIHRVRFERAKRLLTESSMRITDIAHQCGYPDHCRFSTEFRKHVGMPPSQYRQEHAAAAPQA